MNDLVIYLVPALGIFGLIVMAIKSAWVSKQDAGDKNMQELTGYMESIRYFCIVYFGSFGLFRNGTRNKWQRIAR